MDLLIQKLRQDFPDITLVPGSQASWAPESQIVTYSLDTEDGPWTLLHEFGHALLGHTTYHSDVNLVQKEAAAWEKALRLGERYAISIADAHIQECLDTYRDWLHKRSKCPRCDNHGLQTSQSLYSCTNCQTTWKVSSARFCRPYRLKTSLAA